MSNSFKLFIISVLLFNINLCYSNEIEYKTDDKGNVVYTMTLENLPHSKGDVYKAAKNYFETAYKNTKYKISYESEGDGIIVGTGSFQQFFQGGNAIKVMTFNVDFQLRVDAKDNRARLQIIAKDYQVATISDLGSDDKATISISSVSPFTDNKDNKKTYKKAFETLTELVEKTLKESSESIKSYSPTGNITTEDW